MNKLNLSLFLLLLNIVCLAQKNISDVLNNNENNTTQGSFEFENDAEKTDTIFSNADSINASLNELSFEEKFESIKFKTGNFYDEYKNIDTSLYNFHNYEPYNKNKFQYVNLGSIGSPLINLIPTFSRKNLNFNFGFNQFKIYRTKFEEIETFKLNTPYSFVNWTFGPKNRQFLTVKHSNRIRDKIQLGLTFKKYTDFGYYYEREFRLGQGNVSGTNHSDLSFYLDFENKYKNYNGTLLGNVNEFFYKQSGGTMPTNESVFEQINTSIFNRAAVPINLSSAFSKESNIKIAYKQNFKFGKSRVVPISDTSTIIQFIPTSQIQHQISIENEKIAFVDEGDNASFYPDTIFVGSYNDDSTKIRSINNNFDFIKTGNILKFDSILKSKFKYNIGIKHQFIKVENLFENNETNLQNAFLKADFYSNILNNSEIKAQAHYGFLGVENKSYLLNLALLYKLNKQNNFTIKAKTQKFETAYFNNNYTSNFLQWQNNYGKTQHNKIELKYLNKKFNLQLQASINDYNNFVYFTTNTTSTVANFTTQRLFVKKNFKLKNFRLNNQLTIQNISNTVNIDLPTFVYKGSFFYDGNKLTNLLDFQIGFDVFYNSSYFTPTYFAYTNMFVYEKNYQPISLPIVDVFFNFKVKTVNCYFKTEFANQGLFQKGYLTSAGYPNQDVAFRFGFSWMFLD